MIKDTSNIDYTVQIFQGRGVNSSFINCEAKNDGGCIYLSIRGNLKLTLTNTYFEGISADQNGGVIMVPEEENAS